MSPPHLNPEAETSNNQMLNHPGSIASNLCYACHATWTSKSIRGNPTGQKEVPVPIWVSAYSDTRGEFWNGKKMEADGMRNMIKDFLLDSGS